MPTNSEQNNIRKPGFFWFYTDPARAFGEFWLTLLRRVFYRSRPLGDGHPVLVVPGFTGSEVSTKLLRDFIDDHGFQSYDWELGRNLADYSQLDKLDDRLREIYHQHHCRVSLVGWSLGGIYVRELAKDHPEMVRQLITIASPFAAPTAPNNARWLYDWVKEKQDTPDLDQDELAQLPNPAPVPTTAIYSCTDGILPWRACIEQEDPLHRNLRVDGSHLGLGWSFTVMKAVVERLQLNWLDPDLRSEFVAAQKPSKSAP